MLSRFNVTKCFVQLRISYFDVSGEIVEAEPRPVVVHRSELLWHQGERAAFEIECSSGTYVRSLVADLGDAYCEALRRTAIGPFSLEAADGRTLIPLDEALARLPEPPPA